MHNEILGNRMNYRDWDWGGGGLNDPKRFRFTAAIKILYGEDKRRGRGECACTTRKFIYIIYVHI